MKSSCCRFILGLCLALTSTTIPAAVKYWDINGATAGAGGATPGGAWTSALWSTDSTGAVATTTFASGDDAVFSAGTDATGTFTVSGNATASSITIEEGKVALTGVITLGAGAITINSGATLSANSSLRISATAGSVMTINGGTAESTNPGAAGSFVDVDQTIVLNGGGTLSHTVAGVLNIVQGTTTISGTGPLTKEGAGIMAIASACTYSGATTINNGTLRIRTSNNRLPTGTDLTIASGAVFDVDGLTQQIGSLSGGGNVELTGTSSAGTLIIGGSASPAAYSGVIFDGTQFGKVVKQGTGTMTLSGVNTYDGSFTNIAGTTIVTSGAALADPNVDLVINGGTVNLNNAAQMVLSLSGSGGTLNLNTGHAFTVNPAGTRTFLGAVTGAGAVTKSGAGTTGLLGTNNYTGATTLTGGKLITSTASTGAGSYSVADTTALGVKYTGGGSALAMNGLTVANSTMEFDLVGLAFPSGRIVNDTGTMDVNGTVTMDVKGLNTTGLLTLLEHTGARNGAGTFALGTLPPHTAGELTDDTANKKVLLNVTNADALSWVSDAGGVWDVNNVANQIWKLTPANVAGDYQENALQGDTVRFDDTATGTTTVNVSVAVSPYRVTVDNSVTNYTFSGAGKITGLTTLTKSGTGELTLSTANDYSGGSTINAGTLNIGNNAALGTGKATLNGNIIIRSDSATARTLANAFDLNSSVTMGDAVNIGDLTFSGVIAQTGGITKVGSGALSLTAANTFSGGVAHNAGALRVNNNASLGAANSSVTLANGVTLSVTALSNRTLTYNWTVNGDFTLGQTSTAGVTMAGWINLAGAARAITAEYTNHTISGVISNGSLIKAGTGTLILTSPTNTYSGTTTINAGTLSVDGDARMGDGTGTVIFNGGNLNASADRNSELVPNPISILADAAITTTSTAAAADFRFASGAITASAGKTLTLRNDGADAATDVFEAYFSGGGISYSEAIVIDNGAIGKTRLNFFNTNTDPAQTFSGVISGNGSINRSASVAGTGGTTILSGANTYSGDTTVGRGTLLVNNTTGSGTGTGTVTVNSGGVLGGTGTVGGAVVVNSGGIVAAGASAGTLTLANGLDLSTGGTDAWELGANSTTPGTFDVISLTGGNLVLGGTSKLSLNFTGTASSPPGGDVFWSSPHSWTVVSLAGGSNPGDSDFFSVVNGVYTNGYFTTSVSAGNVSLNFTPGAPPQPAFSSVTGAGTTSVTLNFSGLIKGVTYQVQYKNDLNDVSWSILGNVTATGSTAAITDTTNPAPAQRFYRIVEQ